MLIVNKLSFEMARVEETIKAAEGSGLMTLDELVELLKPMYFDR